MEDLENKVKGKHGEFPANIVDSVAGDRLDNPANPREQAFADGYNKHKGKTADDAKAKIDATCK